MDLVPYMSELEDVRNDVECYSEIRYVKEFISAVSYFA